MPFTINYLFLLQ